MKRFWDDRYAEEGFAYGTEPNAFLADQLREMKPGKILFVCEGEGRNAVYAAKLGWDVTAVDFSEVGREKAMKLAGEQNVQIAYEVYDIEEFETDEKFDVVACVFCHFPSLIRKSVHDKLTGFLRSGGVLFMQAFAKEQLGRKSGGPQNDDLLYSMPMLREDFSELKIVHIEEEIADIREGKYHRGKCAVINLIVRKKH